MMIKMPSGVYKRTDGHKRKISEASKGRIPWNKGMSNLIIGNKNPMYGKKHSKETKLKMSKANSGKNNAMYGKSSHGKKGTYKQWKINRSSGIKKKWYKLIYYIKTKLRTW